MEVSRISLPSNIKICFDKWSPIKLIGKGMQGSIWQVCSKKACNFVLKLHTGVIPQVNEVEFHYISADLDVAPKIIELMGTNVFHCHGISEILINGTWLKLTPVFDKKTALKASDQKKPFKNRGKIRYIWL